MRVSRFCLIGLFFLLTACAGTGVNDYCGLREQATVPFAYEGSLPIVTARINGQDVFMGIDTGASRTVLTPELAAWLNLPRDEIATTSVTTVSGNLKSGNALVGSFAFADVVYQGSRLPVISIPFRNFRPDPARPGAVPVFGGLIGADILSHYDIDFDPARQRMALYDAGSCQKISPPGWRGTYAALPMALSPHRLFTVPTRLDGYPVDAEFDTGSGNEVIGLNVAMAAGLGRRDWDSIPADGHLNEAGGNAPTEKIYQFPEFQVGRDTIRNASIAVIDHTNTANMLLGEDYMRQNHFWISYATQTLYVQPQQYQN